VFRGVNIFSNYVYIGECDSEQEARHDLGPPPSEEGIGGSTATPSGNQTATETAPGDGTTTRPSRRRPSQRRRGNGGADTASDTPTISGGPASPRSSRASRCYLQRF
jgi:hypothetical protein